jgi:ribosomal protein RSM22 (predicted rRNA methylase)
MISKATKKQRSKKKKQKKRQNDPLQSLWATLDKALALSAETPFDATPQFQRAVLDLHEALTTNRSQDLSRYMSQASHRSAYAGYYLPLNALKFLNIFEKHHQAFSKSLPDGWIDYGCGPGTASLAALIYLSKNKQRPSQTIPIFLYDKESKIMTLASKLVASTAKNLGLPVQIQCLHRASDLKHSTTPNVLAGNIINELRDFKFFEAELNLEAINTVLFLEPSHRASSQKLITLRELVLDKKNSEAQYGLKPTGPCTHQQRCPLADSKHWCHFSEPMTSERLRRMNLAIFDNPRLWLKFSYLLLTKPRPTAASSNLWHRAIGDVHMSGPDHLAIDLCQPDTKRVLRLKVRAMESLVSKGLGRGALVKVTKTDMVKEIFSTLPQKTPRRSPE